MKTNGKWVLLTIAGVCACVTVLTLLKAQAGTGAARTDLNVAVVNLPRLFNGLSEWKDYQEELRKKNQQMERVNRALSKELEVLDGEIKQLAMGTEERTLKEDELMRKKQEWQLKMNQYSSQMARMTGQFLEKLYRNVLVEVDSYAKAHDIDLVMKTQSIDAGKERIPLQTQVDVNTIIYAGNRADITDDITAIMNKKYGKLLEVK